MKDRAVYTDTGLLAFEAAGRNEVLALAHGRQTGRSSVATILTLREAIKARRALTRTIRAIRARQGHAT